MLSGNNMSLVYYFGLWSFSLLLLFIMMTLPLEARIHTVSDTSMTTTITKSPFEAGYYHGCSDVRISDFSDRYINQPGKGQSFHTEEFMRGYNTGYNQCFD